MRLGEVLFCGFSNDLLMILATWGRIKEEWLCLLNKNSFTTKVTTACYYVL